ncbi:crossover junction endodeoxyribonuclease RuvC [Patescibacteria group bacterium]
MRTILAIDPGTATTGYAILQISRRNSNPKLVSYGCIITTAKTPLPKRLAILAKDLRSLISRFHPQELAVEELFFAKNVKTGTAVGQARGVILLIGAEKKLKIAEYKPVEIKLAVTGYGQAPKKQIQRMVKTILGLETRPRPDDAADAIALGLCHLQTRKFE